MDKDTEFFKTLQHALKTQNMDSQASPRFWVLMDYRNIPVRDGYEEFQMVYDSDACESSTPEELVNVITDEINAAIKDNEPDPITIFYEDPECNWTPTDKNLLEDYDISLQGALAAKAEISCEFTAFDWIATYGTAMDCISDNMELVPSVEESYIVPNTLFITKDEAEIYIERYGYNHSSKVHTYAMTALRSPSVSQLFELLERFDWDTIQQKDK